MKKKSLVALSLLSGALMLGASSQASAEDNPCVVAMCLWGKLQNGSTPEGCSDAERTFFDIKKKKHGSFLPDHTFDARAKFLNKCPDPGREYLDKILNKFGRMKNG